MTGTLVGREKLAGASPAFRPVLLLGDAGTSDEFKTLACCFGFADEISRWSSVMEECELPDGETPGINN